MSTFLNKLRAAKLGSTLTLLALVLVWSTPTVGLLITSLRERDEAAASGWWTALFDPFNQVWSWESYQKAIDGGMLEALLNTIVISVPATILPLIIAANAAFAFTFIEFKGREVMFAALVALMVLPLQSALIPVLKGMVWLKKNVGIDIVGNFAAAWIMHAAFALPLAIYILRNFMMTLPTSLIEAARIDGASYYQIFWKLILPMSMPSIASFAIFQFLWVWNDYLIAFIFVGEQKSVMTYKLLRLIGQYGDGWQTVAAGSFIALIVPLMVFFGLQRYFVRGLTAGAVK
ncbi:carbohydrate ABC transporter permease [Rhodoluna sp.]|jgi:alpha-glucoside transport system permease protein|uniref:carbohydrate ABC transporter permease n=1 Tax=Rhodoluna sp. TaxID=1969481 RepID=UPI0025EB29A8|nr:carbohydrate ABC transporter permease [Rhodoluna sp.]